MTNSQIGTPALWRRLDALLLAALVVARLRIDTLAEGAYLPLRQQDVARQPWLGHLLPPQAMELLAQQQLVDPIGLLLIVAALGCLLAYLLVHEFVRGERSRYWVRLTLVWILIGLTVFAPSMKLILLRQGSGPASYSHDGGVIQTEATIDFLLHGRNPYVEDYTATPMAEWGINEFRTALYHYPYLPWTFLFSAPFKLLADSVIGWYDQRFVYLLLFALTLLLLPGLARERSSKLLLVMLIGLNPIMGSDLIYGQNDSFVLAWLVLSLWLWRRGQESGRARTWGAAAAFGLACASKPTAWFLAPFYLFLLAGGAPADLWRRPGAWLHRAARAGWPAVVAAVLVIGPYLLWNPAAMIDDVWQWANGTSANAYQIWGWGASNLTLALGWTASRFAYWPFWIPQLLIGAPLMGWLGWRQTRENTAGRALWSYALFLFVFFFFSRFLNENYLGYILAVLILAICQDEERCSSPVQAQP
ncbi:MAG: glycosyltransferase 87 family protein [Chloroflexi bacterium]|nr:glycosyltransferase 87 family protein [Chloroflexota bacterium]